MNQPEDDDDYVLCPSCLGDGGAHTEAYEDGEVVGDAWIPCINCGGEGTVRKDK